MAHQQESFHPFSSRQSLTCFLSRVAKREHPKAAQSQLSPKLRNPKKPPAWLPHLGLNPRANFPLQPHFWHLPQLATAASIPLFFQLYWAAIVSPMVWSQSSPSSHAGSVTRGKLPPSCIMGWRHSHPPGSKPGHSYLPYLWNQLKVIDMLNDHSKGYLQNCCCSKQLSMVLFHASHLPAQTCWGEDILYIYFF